MLSRLDRSAHELVMADEGRRHCLALGLPALGGGLDVGEGESEGGGAGEGLTGGPNFQASGGIGDLMPT